MYPKLSRMALDYLTIPGKYWAPSLCRYTSEPCADPFFLSVTATSVDVERVFSRGRLLLSHIRNRLGAQSTRAILCLGSWAAAGFVKAADERKVAKLEDVDDEDSDASDFEMEDGWDAIDVSKL